MPDKVARSAGFAPVARRDARILILGSLPSQRSIETDQYYAHPQNAFWKIMGDLTGAKGSYKDRCQALVEHKIALWDVLASSVRPGSLDSDIQMHTAEVNDFATFLSQHDALELICFNGKTAARIFERGVQAGIESRAIRLRVMPSSSPAHAAISFAEKLGQWRNLMALDEMPAVKNRREQ